MLPLHYMRFNIYNFLDNQFSLLEHVSKFFEGDKKYGLLKDNAASLIHLLKTLVGREDLARWTEYEKLKRRTMEIKCNP